MRAWSKNPSLAMLLWLAVWPAANAAQDYAARIYYAELVPAAGGYELKTEINYRLSPTAREALQKGVLLTWDVMFEICEVGALWKTTVYSRTLPYSLYFHALLNQYEVKSPGQSEMFLSLSTALNFMALVQDEVYIDSALFRPGKRYELRLKTRFNRELLPIPLRPVAYLDSQWFLSSNWFTWPIQN